MVKTNWVSNVDWNKHDMLLSKEFNISRERVRQVRKGLGLPSSRLIKKPKRFKVNLQNADWSASNVQLAGDHGLAPLSVSIQRSYWAPDTKRVSIRPLMEKVNWNLSFRDINNYLFKKRGSRTSLQNLSRYKKIFAPHLIRKRQKF